MIRALLTNDLFLSCLVSGISAQVIKYGIQTVKTRKLKLTPVHTFKKNFSRNRRYAKQSFINSHCPFNLNCNNWRDRYKFYNSSCLCSYYNKRFFRRKIYVWGSGRIFECIVRKIKKRNKNWHNRNKSSQGTQKERGSNGHNNRNSLCIYCVLFIVQGKNKWCAF